jgi:CRISPR/Cas system CSM-associated protein Csm3 (group 7 of RAMP superfamily)
LRSYLRERQLGYCANLPRPPKDNTKRERDRFNAETEKERGWYASILFGGARGDDDGNQSALVVHDALGQAIGYELRDGVRIEPETRTAQDEKKYDTTLLAAGSTFELRFDLLIGLPDGCSQVDDEGFKRHRERLLLALATALDGLANGEITLGARKRRGFGRCSVNNWIAYDYDLLRRDGLLAWLAEDYAGWTKAVEPREDTSIRAALGVNDLIGDQRQCFTLSATFALDGSLLVRSGTPDQGPDMVHLQSLRPSEDGEMKRRPILAGTSWAGALRSRATQILYTLAPNEHVKMRDCVGKKDDRVTELIESLFGPEEVRAGDRNAKASRVEITETVIEERDENDREIVKRLEQTRIRIDRFTGGAFESALFSEEPLFGSPASRLTLELALRLPQDHLEQRQQAEIGMLLLLLKDLWTGDLPLGGEVGIGRGRLRGLSATLGCPGKKPQWQLSQADEQSPLIVTEGDRDALQSYVDALGKELGIA